MPLDTVYQQFIHLSRYARWRNEVGRRETWPETVSRYCDFMDAHVTNQGDSFPRGQVERAILNLDVVPSMRALMTAGPALDRCHVAAYNCCYLPIDHPRAFDEILYVLMCGTGVGYSVERQCIAKLPEVPERLVSSSMIIQVDDSKEGWAQALGALIDFLYEGVVPRWDTTQVRPAGTPLKTFGGRASGPEPLEALFRFTIETFNKARGRKLTSIECHDLACKIGEMVVVGGVRRSALISLSNLSDERMRVAKHGSWWETEPYRAIANNSIAFTEKPDVGVFMKEWMALYESKSGERGLFNRVAATKQAVSIGRSPDYDYGCNPCSEIILRPCQFCNLTEIIARANDSLEDLKRKALLATALGTYQATLTNFKYVRPVWREQTEEERLLGVSITGIMDHPVLSGREGAALLAAWLGEMREVVYAENAQIADRLGIPRSAALTCVKPSGTVSQLVDSSSGIHPRWSRFYLRRVRVDKKDPIAQFLMDAHLPHEDDLMQPENTAVFSFPQRAPFRATLREDLSALGQLELWKIYQRSWTDHKPSITVYVKEKEWPQVGAWVWDNFDVVSGISFLPYSQHSYQQAPYEEIGEADYHIRATAFPTELPWDQLPKYEQEDHTVTSQELACTANACEVV